MLIELHFKGPKIINFFYDLIDFDELKSNMQVLFKNLKVMLIIKNLVYFFSF